jgi:cytochrome b
MNTPSASPADAARRILVWDAPVRVFHWLLVLCFAGAYATAESETWRLLHVTLGYTFGGLLVFRILWGLVGTRHARFASFVKGPAAVGRYLRGLVSRHPEHHVGHNPAGALAIVAILGLGLALAASGVVLYQDLAGEWVEELHEVLGNGLLLIAGVHVSGVVLSSRLHHENLVAAMLTGRKLGDPREGIRRAWGGLAALMLAAVLGFWWLQWQDAPAGGLDASAAHAKQDRRQGLDRDDD